MDLGKVLTDINFWYGMIGMLIVIGIFLAGFFSFMWKYIRLQYRFSQNLKRTIYFFKTSDLKTLQVEKQAINSLGLFKVEQEIKLLTNLNVLQQISDSSVIIIGYDAEFKDYFKIIEFTSSKKIPIIIYAKQGEIKDPKHWEIFNSHISCDVANTTNRILVILLNTLMVN